MLLLSFALAAPVVHDAGLIAEDLEAGIISPADALFYRFQTHFDSEGLPDRYVDSVHEGWSCGTGLVMDLKEQYHILSPEQQQRVDELLVPWGGRLLEPFEQAPLSPPAGNDTCFGQYGAKRIFTEHFSVEYDSSVSDNKAEEFGEHLEQGLDSMVNEWGWLLAQGQNNYKMLAFISSQNGGGAYTSAENCSSGGGWMPYIVTYQNVLDGDWSKSMAVHEYNHAQQFTYGFSHKFWYWEATATYIEELAHPSDNWWSSYVWQGYSQQPSIGMEESSQQSQSVFMHMYGMAVWDFYLDQHVGGPELVLEAWKYSRNHGSQYDLDMDDVIEGLGYDWDETYTGFMAANTVFDYDESQYFGDLEIEDEVNSLPADGGGSAPGMWGQDYIEIDPREAEGLDIQVDFEASGDWYVLLVGTSSTAVKEVVRVELDDGEGSAVLTGVPEYTKAFLVVSPDRTNAGNYSWALSTVEPEVEQPGDDTGYVDTGNPADPGGDGLSPITPAGSCGCGGGAVPGAALALLGLAVLRRRG